MGIFVVVLIQFEPADGRVCRATCHAGELYARAFWCTCIRQFRMKFNLYLIFGSEMHIRGSYIFLLVLRHCDECVPWRSSLFAMIFFITVTPEQSLFTK